MKFNSFARFVSVFLMALFSLNAIAETAQWSRFHGIDGFGHVASGEIPSQWTEADYAWTANLGDRDVGSPVVFGDTVYLMDSDSTKQQIMFRAFDLKSGKEKWSRQYDHPTHHLHRRNTFASTTPAADKNGVVVAWSNPNHTYLKCFDNEGNEIWSRDFGRWQSQHGFGTSPRIVGSMVLLLNSQQATQLRPGQVAGESRMIAVDRESGATMWESKLNTTRSCYGVPAIKTMPDGSMQVIAANTGNGLFGLDAKTGKRLWNLPVFEMRCCTTPLVIGDIAIGSSGSGGGGNHLVAVRIPKSADEQPEQLYRIDRGAPYVPTPVVKDGHLFMVDDKGIASCIDSSTGETIWLQRIGGNFGASPIIVGDKLLLISLEGQATILKASTQYEKLGQVDLGGSVGATPAYSEGRLLIRIGNKLRCL